MTRSSSIRFGRVALALTLVLGLLASTSGSEAVASSGEQKDYEDFDPGIFDDPTTFTNKYLPFKPGTQWTWEGTTLEDDERIKHRLTFAVTDLTKVILGVRTRVVWIVDVSEGEIVEKEIAFFAQGNDGTVWYLGEYPEAYEDGELVEAPAWIAGLDDAHAGIAMEADPKVGSPSYSQGWAPTIQWTDRAQVYKMGEETCTPVDCYKDVLIMDEYDATEPGFKLKYYAPGVGQVRVGWRGPEEGQEELELVELKHLNADEMAEVRKLAIELEANAYKISPDVYAYTSPMEYPPGTPAHTPDGVKSAAEAGERADVRKITDEQAKEIALAAVPGEVMDIAIERKMGAKRIVVEVIAKADLAETDVIIDMVTGKVLAIEK